MKFYALMLLLASLHDDRMRPGYITYSEDELAAQRLLLLGGNRILIEREQREDGLRCVLSYTFFEDAENYERIALCTQERRWCNPEVKAPWDVVTTSECTRSLSDDDEISIQCPPHSRWCKGREIHSERLVVGPTIECAGKGCP